ncbi:P-loop containing nucleoside triphosphate hydrolase protein [Auriculariales sp. MPI-PUGE-AT-0066]|nr:P-loop containing nucleoside triphosphate hydrolase protein [Auriculariales sp. MPI-PUGE-AT-0066]
MPDGGSGGGYGFNAFSEGKYSESRRRMLDLVNRMHAHGAQLDLDLPSIAVIGNQSAGKSSLIESIAGISLPRSSGTCTRCPTECKLSYTASEPWSCSVSLRFITDQYGAPLNPIRNVPFGEVMTDKDEVESRLRRAQLAILDPHSDHNKFLEIEDIESAVRAQNGFSHNYISLQISGPDVPDLSFVDLPGIIASVKDGSDRGDIQLVRSLVTEHIQRPSCIILLTVSCETDFENQGAHELAKEFDPEGQRTIGVLTKPDRIDHGDAPKWIPIFENTQQPLSHGWYMVKQRNTKELEEGISREVARQQEIAYFAETAPWTNLIQMKSRMGTRNLTNKLSEILTTLIQRRLPKLQEEVNTMLDATEDALRQLPPKPSEDSISELLKIVNEFAKTIAQDIQGTPSLDGLIQNIRDDYRVFRRAIRSTAPDFRPFPRNRDATDQSFLNPEFVPSEERIEKHTGKVVYVDEVMLRANKSVTRELPDNYSYIVTQEYILEFVKLWERPAKDMFINVERRVNAHLKRIIEEFFDGHDAGGLNIAVSNAVTSFLNECKIRATERLRWLLAIENEPFTLNEHYLAEYKKKWHNLFKLARRKMENPTLMQLLAGENIDAEDTERVNELLSRLQHFGLACGIQDLPSLLKPDPLDYALRIMAEVRAYYHVAYKRYVDNVPLAIDQEYLRGFERGIHKHLIEALGVSSTDARTKAESYLQEAPDIIQQRTELLTRLERLENARREFLELY